MTCLTSSGETIPLSICCASCGIVSCDRLHVLFCEWGNDWESQDKRPYAEIWKEAHALFCMPAGPSATRKSTMTLKCSLGSCLEVLLHMKPAVTKR